MRQERFVNMASPSQSHHPSWSVQMNCLRTICGFSLSDHRTNTSILHLCRLPAIAGEMQFRQLRCTTWLGLVTRMSDNRLPKRLMFGQVQGTGARGCPMDSWNTIVCKDLANLKGSILVAQEGGGKDCLKTIDCTCTYLARPSH